MKTKPNDPINAVVNAEGFCTSIENVSGKDAGAIGLMKREYFAAMAMQGLRAARLIRIAGDVMNSSKIWTSKEIAKTAVEDAEALIEELNK